MQQLNEDTDYQQQVARVVALRKQQDDSGETARMQAESKKKSFDSLNPLTRVLIGAGSRVNRLVQGGAQLAAPLLDRAYGNPNGQISGRANNAVADSRKTEAAMDGDLAAGVGGFAADMAMLSGPGGVAAKFPGAGRYVGGAAIGAGYGGLQPVLGDESRGINAAVGGALGAAGEGLASGVRTYGQRVAKSISPDARALYEKARAAGIRVTPT